MLMLRRAAFCLGLLVAGWSTGCGPAAPPPEELVPVSGTVRVGGKPQGGVRVMFLPEGETGGMGGVGVTDDTGRYTLMHRTQKEGVPAGKYAVVFSRFLTADGKPVPPETSPYMSGGRESIPAQWSDPTKKGPHNSTTVPEGGKDNLDFAIPGK